MPKPRTPKDFDFGQGSRPKHKTVSRIKVHIGVGRLVDLQIFLTEQQDNVLDYSITSDGSYLKWVARTIEHERVTVPTGLVK